MAVRATLRVAGYLLGAACLCIAGALTWLYLDAHRDRDAWLTQRHGQLVAATSQPLATAAQLTGQRVTLRADSGLQADFRVLRPAAHAARLPVLILLGGHRTGADAVELFGEVNNFAIVALDYPYDGPHRTRGFAESLRALPAIRRAFLDAAPAISLAADWLLQQAWADPDKLVAVGVSLGVPFAATAAARDQRFAAVMLVHGAADNRLWLRHNVALRNDLGPFLNPASYVLDWLAYGKLHDTAKHVAMLAPRLAIVVGAREDERTPRSQTEDLFAAAREPKKLLWTDGRHVQPGRRDVIDALLLIAHHELSGL